MSEGMLREMEVALLSALLKSAAVARDLVKAGFRPDLLPSPEGCGLARLILRVRDATGDVTESVEAQIAEASSLAAEEARLLARARSTPCPDRERALAYLALFELSETSERLQATAARVEAFLGPSPAPGNARSGANRPRATSRRELRRVRMPDPAVPTPGEPADRHKPTSR